MTQQLVSYGPRFLVIGDAYREGDTTAPRPELILPWWATTTPVQQLGPEVSR